MRDADLSVEVLRMIDNSNSYSVKNHLRTFITFICVYSFVRSIKIPRRIPFTLFDIFKL